MPEKPLTGYEPYEDAEDEAAIEEKFEETVRNGTVSLVDYLLWRELRDIRRILLIQHARWDWTAELGGQTLLVPTDLKPAASGIMAQFERYGFRDAQGHPLTTCQDFIDLVNKAAASLVCSLYADLVKYTPEEFGLVFILRLKSLAVALGHPLKDMLSAQEEAEAKETVQ